uniref:Uncharacterized protein n=1 Tax=Salix viminalis TaxID=40686 RepID=A0A6N2NBK8_SALVM
MEYEVIIVNRQLENLKAYTHSNRVKRDGEENSGGLDCLLANDFFCEWKHRIQSSIDEGAEMFAQKNKLEILVALDCCEEINAINIDHTTT